MIASRSERLAAGVLVAALLALGCRTPVAPPVGSALELAPERAPLVPDDLDRAAHDLAAGALAQDRELVERSLGRIEGLDATNEEGVATGLVPYAIDARNATLDDDARDRAATRELLDRDDVDPALASRLEEQVNDDPLALASARMADARTETFGRAFNAVAEPAGHFMMSPISSAIRLARSLMGLAVEEHTADALGLQERQALVQWRRYVASHPEAPDARAIEARIADAEEAWNRTQRDRAMRRARAAMKEGQYGPALLAAERALSYAPEDGEATRVRREAQTALAEARANRDRSLEVALDPRASLADQRDLAVALLRPGGDVTGEARRLLDRAPDGPLADEARFSLALAAEEADREETATQLLQEVAGEDPAQAGMARHAFALLASPDQNPYGAFTASRTRDVGDQVGWIFLGPLANGPRDLDLPSPLEWIIETPAFLEAFTSFPNRLVRYPWMSPWPFGRAPATHARRYLAQHPNGEHAEEVRGWLVSYEQGRANPAAALEAAESARNADPAQIAALREAAARQALDAAKREKRADLRGFLARRVAREFHDTEAGREAGEFARSEAEKQTPQRIRMTRNFLLENPRVAGSEGLGLKPEVLDGRKDNGELHPDGVVLAGGRVIELQFLAPSGDSDDPPVIRRQEVSSDRLARIVSLLEETSIRNARIDPDDVLSPDAGRDQFFERARLGVADTRDPRGAAQSTYVYKGMRDRYGLVRGRESILPVDLVLQGTLPTLGLGAFPRIRMPKPTPDAILYR